MLERLEFSILELGLFWGRSYEALGGLFVVVGPGGRISTVDCSRVLNVNGSLYSSTSRVERSEPACTRPRLVLLERVLFTFILSTVVLLL